MAPDTQVSSGMRAHLLSVLIGTLGAFVGYTLIPLISILLLQGEATGNPTNLQNLNEIFGDVYLFTAVSFYCGSQALLACGLLVGLPTSLLATRYHWRRSIANFTILLISAILGVGFSVLWNVFMLFSFFATGGLE